MHVHVTSSTLHGWCWCDRRLQERGTISEVVDTHCLLSCGHRDDVHLDVCLALHQVTAAFSHLQGMGARQYSHLHATAALHNRAVGKSDERVVHCDQSHAVALRMLQQLNMMQAIMLSAHLVLKDAWMAENQLGDLLGCELCNSRQHSVLSVVW